MPNNFFGGIEGGGTHFNCIIAKDPENILSEMSFSTTSPSETVDKVVHFFVEHIKRGVDICSVGLGSFGPLDLNTTSETFGSITHTPKPGWSNTPILKMISEKLPVPVSLDTDVNCAALGEGLWGEAQRLTDFLYITVGTGIGGGLIIHGKPVHGMVHSELGHILIPHDREKDPFTGICPFHGDCLEGLACGPSLKVRWKQLPEDLPASHPAWDLEAEYLATALHNLIYTISPQRVILGGGVMKQVQLYSIIHQKVLEKLKDYAINPFLKDHIEKFIVPPGLDHRSGALGAIALAKLNLTP
jgi:fructokinase